MMRALVIDDNRQVADYLCKMLGLLQISAEPAYGSRDALVAIGKILPDIVFLDINMPGVSGMEVLAYMRRIPALDGIPVVVVTSDDQPETARRAIHNGALGVIVKPATLTSVEEALRIARVLH